MNEKTENNLKDLKETLKSIKVIKTTLYIGVGVLTLYILSKAFTGLASTVRGYNDLKSALNGN
jgi:hypothetical protein